MAQPISHLHPGTANNLCVGMLDNTHNTHKLNLEHTVTEANTDFYIAIHRKLAIMSMLKVAHDSILESSNMSFSTHKHVKARR